MPETSWSQPDESGNNTSADWIKSNMFGDHYSVELGRSLTDAEIRFQKCLEQLPVPSWYLTYSKKKPSIRQNCIPFDKRPPTWKSIKLRAGNSPRKSPKKRSPKGSANNSDSESPVTSRADSGFNETYRISRRTPKKNKSPCISITSSSSDDESDTQTLADADETLSVNLSQLNRTPRNGSFTFPRMTPSRKIENINIVFPKPSPPCVDEPERTQRTSRRTIYTKTKNIELCPYESELVEEPRDDTHTTFLIADVDPEGVHTRIHVSAGIATPSFSSSSSCSFSDEEATAPPQPAPRSPEPRSSPSPNTRFFTSRKKSTALEKIVQRNLGNPRGSLVQEIIGELERSATERSTASSSDDFVRGMIGALEESLAGDSDEDYQRNVDGDLESASDSELAKSTSISLKSSTGCEDSGDEEPSSPLRVAYSAEESSSSSEEDVYWIPMRMTKMPRTSSRLSMLSRASSGRSSIGTAGRSSPGLSPIRRECPEDWFSHPSRAWGYTYSTKKDGPPRSLFRIDESGQLDSGYSDTASSRRTAPSRTATVSSGNSGYWPGSCRTTTASSCDHDRYTPTGSSATCSPTYFERDAFNDAALNNSGPYVLKSFMV